MKLDVERRLILLREAIVLPNQTGTADALQADADIAGQVHDTESSPSPSG